MIENGNTSPVRALNGPMDDIVYNDPTNVDAEDGNVVLDGPGGVDVKMTPEAAEETSHRLLEGALDARGQQIAKGTGPKRT